MCPHTPFRLLSCLGDKGDRRVAEIAESVGHEAKVEFVDRRPPSAAEAARHCHLLLAVWDGDENGPADSVAGLIRYKLDGVSNEGKAEWTPLDSPEAGPVYDVRPPRHPAEAAVRAKRYPPPPDDDAEAERSDPALRMKEAEGAYRAILGCVDKFNGDVAEVLPALENVRLDSRDSLLLEDDDRTKPPDEQRRLAGDREKGLPPAARAALDHFAAADALALHFQKRAHWAFRALFASALLAMIVFEVYAHSIHDFDPKYHPLGTGRTSRLWALSLGLWWFFVRRTDYQNRRQVYQAAQPVRMRVQFFWRVAGLPDAAEDHYLRKQRSELEWIRYALRTWNAFGTDGADAAGEPAAAGAGVGFVARRWVRGQHQWFRKSARCERGRHLGWRGTGDALFILNLAGAAALFVVLLILLGRQSAVQASEPGPSGTTGLSSATAHREETTHSRGESGAIAASGALVGDRPRADRRRGGPVHRLHGTIGPRAARQAISDNGRPLRPGVRRPGEGPGRPTPGPRPGRAHFARIGQGGAGRKRRLAAHAPRTAVGGAAAVRSALTGDFFVSISS